MSLYQPKKRSVIKQHKVKAAKANTNN